MPDLSDLKIAVKEFNKHFPRPDMSPLKLSGKYDIRVDYSEPFPHAERPGVYIIFNTDNEVLRIGKVSCKNTLGNRLSAYYKWGQGDSEGVGRHEGYGDAKLIRVIGFPNDRAFEAPALEEFLIGKLNPPYNTNGTNKLS